MRTAAHASKSALWIVISPSAKSAEKLLVNPFRCILLEVFPSDHSQSRIPQGFSQVVFELSDFSFDEGDYFDVSQADREGILTRHLHLLQARLSNSGLFRFFDQKAVFCVLFLFIWFLQFIIRNTHEYTVRRQTCCLSRASGVIVVVSGPSMVSSGVPIGAILVVSAAVAFGCVCFVARFWSVRGWLRCSL